LGCRPAFFFFLRKKKKKQKEERQIASKDNWRTKDSQGRKRPGCLSGKPS
jgi:hypothetical protein